MIFQEQGGAVIPGEMNVMDRTFTASGLTPHTNYIFRVAGVNSNIIIMAQDLIPMTSLFLLMKTVSCTIDSVL